MLSIHILDASVSKLFEFMYIPDVVVLPPYTALRGQAWVKRLIVAFSKDDFGHCRSCGSPLSPEDPTSAR